MYNTKICFLYHNWLYYDCLYSLCICPMADTNKTENPYQTLDKVQKSEASKPKTTVKKEPSKATAKQEAVPPVQDTSVSSGQSIVDTIIKVAIDVVAKLTGQPSPTGGKLPTAPTTDVSQQNTNTVRSKITGELARVWDKLESAADSTIASAWSMVQKAKDTAVNTAGQAVNIAKEQTQWVVNTAKSVWSTAANIGKDTINSAVDKTKNTIDQAQEVTKKAIDTTSDDTWK